MRFVFGPVPPSVAFDHRDTGWLPVREWTASRLAVAAVLLGFPFLAAAIVVFGNIRGELHELFRTQPLAGVAFVLALVGMVPLHELVHALAYGKGLCSRKLIFGFYPSGGLCYVIYDAPMPLRRVLGMLMAPLLALSVLPLLFLPFLQGTAFGLALILVLIHTGICGGDLIVIWRLISQVPRNGLVHNDGWQTYWHA